MFFVAFFASSIAQCNDCSPDTQCGGVTNFPAVCPQQAADATSGEYYEQVLTFYIPNQVTDPQSGLTATLISVEIASVSGLPFGLTYSLNDEDGVYYPSQGQNYGCATLCGTPLLPGTYSILITVNALVSFIGQQFTETQSFPTTITVLQGESTTSSFTYNNQAGCGSLEVDFHAIISAPSPAITTYSWSFGNGQTSTLQNPQTTIYDTEGEYDVSLTTTVASYKLHSVTLQSLSPGWNDIEELFSGPDPYFVLLNASGTPVYTSSVQDNTSTYTWNGLNITLDQPPYSIQFFDRDQISADDDLGTSTLSIGVNDVFFSSGTGTVGFATIYLDTTTEITDEATILVFPIPDPDFTVTGNVLMCNNEDLFSYLWYRNGGLISDSEGPSYTMTEGGQYYVEVQNEYGCAATSSAYLYCLPVAITYDALAMELEVPNAFSSYQWYFNGLPISGATSYFVSAIESGDYSVQVTTNYGCNTTSEVYSLVVGVEEGGHIFFRVYPNPIDDVLNIESNGTWGEEIIFINDISGRKVWEKRIVFSSDITQIDLSNLPSGVYALRINNGSCRLVKK